MDDLKRRFGRKVRRSRLALGLSQEELALACGLDRTYVGSVERGERNISLINIAKLADALRITPSDLLNFCDLDAEGVHNDVRRPKESPDKSGNVHSRATKITRRHQ
jgi:transcriptional regulator with XRE-family HTH domain